MNSKNPLSPEQVWISRAEAGRRLNVSPQWIGVLCSRGYPWRHSDGMVCWPDFQFAYDWFGCPRRSGSWRFRHGDDDPLGAKLAERARREREPAAQRWYAARRAGTDAASVANRAIAREAARLMSGSFG